MHYYKKNIGDYAKKAGRLSILQHGVYNLLIDSCYDRERFPTLDDAIDWTWASTKEEVEAVEFVLKKFFEIDDSGVYVQGRIQEEINEYHEFCETQAENGKKGGRPKKKPEPTKEKPTGLLDKPVGNPPESHRGQNKTLTTNHKQLTNKKAPAMIDINMYMAMCDEAGVDCVPITDPIMEYADNVSLPPEFLSLCWKSFSSKYSDGTKKYKDWKAVFRRAVKENWLKLWWISDDGSYQLTTAGKQAQKLQESQS